MRKHLGKTDENILAGYLAGDLPPRLMSEIASYLAKDESNMELLGMAREALNSANTGREYGTSDVRETRRKQRRTKSPQFIPTGRASWYTVATLAIVFVGIYLLSLLNGYTSSRSSSVPSVGIEWHPVIGTDHFSISWSSVMGAVSYVVVVMDPSKEKMVSRIETSSTSVPSLFSASDSEVPRSGEILELWIAAFSEDGQLLRRSERIPFTADQ